LFSAPASSASARRGICCERGHEVIVVDRQPGAALETSFANAGQISVSYCEPWANREAPWKALKWMFDKEAPLLFRPQLDWQQWRWGLRFLAQCNDGAFERNVQQMVALGAYSHGALKDMVRSTGIEYHRLERGIAHFYSDQKSFDDAAHAVELMRKHGVQRRVVSRDELLQIEPAFKRLWRAYRRRHLHQHRRKRRRLRLHAATGPRCAERGVQFLYGQDVLRLERSGNAIDSVAISANQYSAGGQKNQILKGDAIVVACGSTVRRCCAAWVWTCRFTPARATAPLFRYCAPKPLPRFRRSTMAARSP
jgi:D-amino-acid dehydrogenase